MTTIFRFTSALLIFLFLSTSSALLAQTYERAFGIELAPHLGGRRLDGTGLPFRQVELQDSLESGIPGFSLGLVFESRAGKLGFTTGIRYLETGYEVIENGLNGPTIGADYQDEIRASYLSIPLDINFHQDITERDRASFTLGMAANLHLGTTTERTRFLDGVNQGTTTLPEDPNMPFRSILLAFNTGIAYDRKLSEKWAVKFQPYFTFFLQGNLQETFNAFNRNYYQTGIRLTVKRVFL
jgi:hypothetical protein